MTLVHLKSTDDLQKMRYAGKITAETLAYLKEDVIRPGITTLDIDRLTREYIVSKGGTPSFLNYKIPGIASPEFPASICISINQEIVHGIPTTKVIQLGDLVSLDLGVNYDGFHGDHAITFVVGTTPSKDTSRLLTTTELALKNAIAQCVVGHNLLDISYAIEVTFLENNVGIVRDLGGHGIGRNLHEFPMVPNWRCPVKNMKLIKGMTLALEPVGILGKEDTKTLADGWTVVSKDDSMSAHFEHTIVITDGPPEVLTSI